MDGLPWMPGIYMWSPESCCDQNESLRAPHIRTQYQRTLSQQNNMGSSETRHVGEWQHKWDDSCPRTPGREGTGATAGVHSLPIRIYFITQETHRYVGIIHHVPTTKTCYELCYQEGSIGEFQIRHAISFICKNVVLSLRDSHKQALRFICIRYLTACSQIAS